jgi:hypothetical protein
VRVWDIVQGQELAPELVDKVDGKDVAKALKDEHGNVTKCYSNMDKHKEKYADWDARGSRVARVIMTAVTLEMVPKRYGLISRNTKDLAPPNGWRPIAIGGHFSMIGRISNPLHHSVRTHSEDLIPLS